MALSVNNMNPITIRNKTTGEIKLINQSELGKYGIGYPSINSFDDLLKQYFPTNQIQNARNIISLESHGNPYAIGDQYPIAGEIRPSYGLFQIRTFPDRPAPQLLMDPRTNIEYAANLYRQQGWHPWYNSARKLGLL